MAIGTTRMRLRRTTLARSASSLLAGVIAVAVLSGCRGGVPGDPGLTFTVQNRCGFDVDVDLRLRTDPAGDWDLIVQGTSVRFAQADAEPAEFIMSVRRSTATSDEVTVEPSSSSITLQEGSGCPSQ